jgi:hypothetical protein
MKGHVPTPESLADDMVATLFDADPPTGGDRILYPGLGDGPFVLAVHRFCEERDLPVPDGVGIESDPELVADAEDALEGTNVDIQERDFLADVDDLGEFEYVIGNPPYVPIEGLDEDEKREYKSTFDTAVGRFDLYILFFEQALDLLADDGRLVFITPEKFEYVDTAEPLRRILGTYHVEEIHHVDEDAFTGKITFPTITTVADRRPGPTTVTRRDGSRDTVDLPTDGSSWASQLRTGDEPLVESGVALGDITERISPGLATGADALFVKDKSAVPPQLAGEWTHPTVSGKQLRVNDGPDTDSVFLCPYDDDGNLIPEDELGAFGDWAEMHRDRLEDRHCVEKGKQWYSWHENPPLDDILQPKILCKDIADKPEFWADRTGDVVPRHTVYYIIPEDHVEIDEMLEYLNGPEAKAWLEANCQRASNGFYRLQTRVMEDLPVPEEWGKTVQETLV